MSEFPKGLALLVILRADQLKNHPVDAVTKSEKLCLLMIGSQNGHLPTYNDLDGVIHLLHLKNSNRDLVMRLVLLPNLHIIYLIIQNFMTW